MFLLLKFTDGRECNERIIDGYRICPIFKIGEYQRW